MKRYIGLLLAIAFGVVGVTMAFNKYGDKVTESERDADFARIRQEYFERVAWIRSNPDAKAYKDEVPSFLRWYFGEINKHLNKFKGNKKFDDYLTELETRSERGAPENKIAEKKAYFLYAKSVFDQLKAADYNPVWTATDKGMRLDIMSMKPTTVGGETKIRFPIVLWGAQRELREDGRQKKMVTSARFSIDWKLTDEKGKLLGEVNVSGDPSMKIDFPERLISEFPAQVLIGHYDFERVPDKTKDAEITFTVSSRSPSGGEVNSRYVWKVPVPSDWKLRPGEDWKGATESIRSQEEIDGTEAKN